MLNSRMSLLSFSCDLPLRVESQLSPDDSPYGRLTLNAGSLQSRFPQLTLDAADNLKSGAKMSPANEPGTGSPCRELGV
jgi:hypothetical protein